MRGPIPGSRRSNGRTRTAYLGVTGAAIAVSLALAGWGAVLIHRYFEKQRESVSRPGVEPIVVETYAVEERDVPLSVEATGFLSSPATISISAEVRGVLRRKHREEGQPAAQGELLAELNDEIYRARVDAARAREASWRAQIEFIRKEKARVERLVSTDSAVASELDRLASELDRAEATLQETVATLREAQLLLEKCRVRSPRSGVWYEDLAEEGEYLQAGQPIGRLRVLDPLELTVEVSGRHRLSLTVGLGVDVTLLDVDETLTGVSRARQDCVVARLPPGASPVSKRFPVVVRVPNPDGRLLPGLFCRARFELSRPDSLLLIPKECVFDRYGKSSVYALGGEDGGALLAEPRFVTLRAIEDLPASWRVLDGLRAGERIIVSPIEQLTPSARVVPRSDG